MIKSRRMRWAAMWHVWRRKEMYTGYWWENVLERGHLEDLGVDGEDSIKVDFQEVGWGT
jgi:hypothetical protein